MKQRFRAWSLESDRHGSNLALPLTTYVISERFFVFFLCTMYLYVLIEEWKWTLNDCHKMGM